MKDDQLTRGNEIKTSLTALDEQKNRIKKSIEFYSTRLGDKSHLIQMHVDNTNKTKIRLYSSELVNGLNLVLMRVEKKIADLEQEFKEL